jgi:hypothetical protein
MNTAYPKPFNTVTFTLSESGHWRCVMSFPVNDVVLQEHLNDQTMRQERARFERAGFPVKVEGRGQ